MTASMFVTDAPVEVYEALGGRWPTKQQWSAISAPLEPSVLIAGAGSGKTAVMAARIVWLIVNGHAKANEILGRTGKPFWQIESYDHWIRNDEGMRRVIRYIEWNPVTAALVANPEEFRWSSAFAGLKPRAG